VLELLKKEVELCRLQADIGKQVEEKISKDQRRYFLQARLAAFQCMIQQQSDAGKSLDYRHETCHSGISTAHSAHFGFQ
jgi:Lon-like ATP-dependent protease